MSKYPQWVLTHMGKNEYFSFVLKVNRRKVEKLNMLILGHKRFFRGLSINVNRNEYIDVFRFVP